ncbi:hypothetical protein LINPERHAP1_LOCUS8451 [Linum perenne]
MQEDVTQNPRCPRVTFSDEEVQSFYKPWSKALVVKVLGKTFAFPTIKCRLENLWARKGHIQVSDVSNAFFLVRFADPEDYHNATFGGPWKIYEHRIGNHIGRTVRLDLATAEGARARYARVCVEVDLTKPLLGKYMIEDMTFYVEYESLDYICFGCGIYSHRIDGCLSALPKAPEEELATEDIIPHTNGETGRDTGEWMTV